MDLGTIIIGAIILAICILPFVIMHYNKTKKRNKTLQSLDQMAKQHNGTISAYEFCSDFVIGIDETNGYVFFLKQKNEGTVTQVVDLIEIQACRADKGSRSIKSKEDYQVLTKRVELCFIPLEKGKPETRFELYDDEVSIMLSGELQLVDAWSKRINDLLKNKKRFNRLSALSYPASQASSR